MMMRGVTRGSSVMGGSNDLVLEKYFKDHHSLTVPSSNVKFHGADGASSAGQSIPCVGVATTGTYVIESEYQQIILQEDLDMETKKRSVEVKSVNSSHKGLQLLRFFYVVFIFVWTGVYVVFCLNILLDLVLELPHASSDMMTIPGILLAMITFSVAFGEGMVLATSLISDIWDGRRLFRGLLFGNRSLIFADWFAFTLTLVIPVLTTILTLFTTKSSYEFKWFTISAIVLYACSTIYFVVFTYCVILYELHGAIQYVQKHCLANGGNNGNARTLLRACHKCILMRLTQRYSGSRRIKFFALHTVGKHENQGVDGGSNEDDEDQDLGIIPSSKRESMSPLSRLTTWSFLSPHCFKVLNKPRKLYNITDAQGLRPYWTKWTWSLERVFCNFGSDRYIAIIDGPGAMMKDQIRSSFVCAFMGTVLVVLLSIALLSWFGIFTAWLWAILSIFVVGIFFILIRKLRQELTLVHKVKKGKRESIAMRTEWDAFASSMDIAPIDESQPQDIENSTNTDVKEELSKSAVVENDPGSEREGKANDKAVRRRAKQQKRNRIHGTNTGLYILKRRERVTEATESFCHLMLFCELVVLYFWPLVTLVIIRMYGIAILFAISVGISCIRDYINIVTVIEETGTMNLLPGNTPCEQWRNQSRLSSVVDRVSTDQWKYFWVFLMGFFALLFASTFFVAQGEDIGALYSGRNQGLTFLPDFYYPGQTETVQYPACVPRHGLESGLPNWSLADYAFLSDMAYRNRTVVDESLSIWFGKSTENVTNEFDYVQAFRADHGLGKDFHGRFSLFRVETEIGTVGVVSQRGTSGTFDYLVDLRLWLTASLVQVLRSAVPFGTMFNQVYPHLIKMTSSLRTRPEDVALYRKTTDFVKQLQNDPAYESLTLTGHSLGGGVAMISGAQTNTNAIAISGPNAKLSRMTFHPPLTVDALNKYTMNVIPERDAVPQVDDVAENYQNIRCTSTSPNPISCHFAVRTLCELLYTCGSGDRPVICECNRHFQYEEPLGRGNKTSFAEECASVRFEEM